MNVTKACHSTRALVALTVVIIVVSTSGIVIMCGVDA